MNRVLIVDDQPSFRGQLRQLLVYAGWLVVGEACDIPAAEALARELHPDLAIVDVFLPGMNGIEGTPRLKTACPRMEVILVSAYGDQADVIHQSAAAVGAAQFLSKDDLDLDRVRAWKTLE